MSVSASKMSSLSEPLNEHTRAIQRAAALAESVGGESAGVAILSSNAAAQEIRQYCPHAPSMLSCLEKHAYEACSVRKNPEECKHINVLLGSAVEQATLSYLETTRKSIVDLYFLPASRASTVRHVHPDVAAISVASMTARR